MLKAICKGERVSFAPGELVEPVEVVLQMGTPQRGASSYCAAFGGQTKKNQPGAFVATGARAPTECSVGAAQPGSSS